ncbi:MAG: exo-alpha-sialidase [Clostridia bacterium]|nr:exo-alpha-sialidase [Clostridia bacterium]
MKYECDTEHCYVHARGLMISSDFGLITMQKLSLSGCDLFDGIEMIKTTDGGKSFSDPQVCESLRREYFADGTSRSLCDATPFYHKKTDKILLTGHMAWYAESGKIIRTRQREAFYAVYDPVIGNFQKPNTIKMPHTENNEYYSCGAGCSQIMETAQGELLIPLSYKPKLIAADGKACSSVVVVRCSFDGSECKVIEMGNKLTTDIPRGLGEPSIAHYGGEYFLALRNDQTGFVSRSEDGLHFEVPRELCFDNGENLGNYNTQQHWLTGGGKLWLVYTRRTKNNNHVFRHRAPLFIGEFDPERMCVIRSTEKIVVPERGARLGNFGCQSYSDELGYVFAAEWMQGPNGPQGCAKYGSDNSIFISKIYYR